MKFGEELVEYRFPFRAQVFAETMTGRSLDQALGEIGKRTVLGQLVYSMLVAANPDIKIDEVYDLMDKAIEAGGLEAIEVAVVEELMTALGNPAADIKRFVKAVKLEDASRKRALKDRIAKLLAEEEGKEPPGDGETPKN